jgi:hypothetical protein
MRAAQKDGVDTTAKYRDLSDAELLKVIQQKQFKPEYETVGSDSSSSDGSSSGDKPTSGAGGAAVGGSGREAAENEILEGSGQSEDLAGIAAS